MKVALIMQHVETSRGGAETSVAQFAQLLAVRGVDVHIYTATPNAQADGITFHHVLSPRRPRRLAASRFIHAAQHALGDADYDIIHAITPCPTADIYQPRGGTYLATGQRTIAASGGLLGRAIKRLSLALNGQYRLMLRLERQMFADPAGPIVVPVSQYGARQLHEGYNLAPPRVRVVFNGVDVDSLTPRDDDPTRNAIRQNWGLASTDVAALFVAHNFKLKGLASAIRALAMLNTDPNRRAMLIVMGRGDHWPYARLGARLGIAQCVISAAPTDRVGPAMHAADLLVHPTYYDPCSRVVLEALASSLPAITTRHNGAAEVIDDGQNGYVIDSADDIAALADRWQRMMDPDLRHTMAQRTAEKRDTISMARHVDDMLRLYDDVAARRRSATR